jgi:Na+/H+-translocating membrane pyrophosphatase
MQFMLGMLVGGMIGGTIGAIVVGACAMAAKADEDELRRRLRREQGVPECQILKT